MNFKKSGMIIPLLPLIWAPAILAGGDQTIKEALAVRIPRTYQRSILAIDPIELTLAAGTWKAPKAGDSVAFPAAEAAKWEKVAADANGWFSGPAFSDGYVYILVKSEKEAPAISQRLRERLRLRQRRAADGREICGQGDLRILGAALRLRPGPHPSQKGRKPSPLSLLARSAEGRPLGSGRPPFVQ